MRLSNVQRDQELLRQAELLTTAAAEAAVRERSERAGTIDEVSPHNMHKFRSSHMTYPAVRPCSTSAMHGLAALGIRAQSQASGNLNYSLSFRGNHILHQHRLFYSLLVPGTFSIFLLWRGIWWCLGICLSLLRPLLVTSVCTGAAADQGECTGAGLQPALGRAEGLDACAPGFAGGLCAGGRARAWPALRGRRLAAVPELL